MCPKLKEGMILSKNIARITRYNRAFISICDIPYLDSNKEILKVIDIKRIPLSFIKHDSM